MWWPELAASCVRTVLLLSALPSLLAYFPPRHASMRLAANSSEDTGRILAGLLAMLGVTSTTPVPTQLQNRITPGCDFYQNVEPGDRFYVYSPNYPNTFAPFISCRWFAVAAVGSRLQLECREVQLDEGDFGDGTCEGGDVLLVSLSGDARLRDVHGYCGVGSFIATSKSNLLNVVFEAGPRYIPGNRFNCVLTLRADVTTTTSTTTTTTTTTPEPTTTEPAPMCACGSRYRNRIVGGMETGVNEFPMMAGVVELASARVFCGAALISSRRAVTAAHCLVQRSPSNVVLLVGDHDLSSGADTNKAAVFRIRRFLAHPRYNSVTQQNDIAVIETVQEIPFSKAVGPACLPFRFEDDTFEGEDVFVLGWGSTSFGGETSSTLQKAELTVVSDAECIRAYPSNVGPQQICTFRNGSDACQSDSGGPVLWQDPRTQRLHLVGVISYGIRCASNFPAVNTRVTAYLDWIQQVTGDDFCVSR